MARIAPVIHRFVFAGGRVLEEPSYYGVEETHAFSQGGIRVDHLGRIVRARELLKPHCESPIEVILGSFMFVLLQEMIFEPFEARVCLGHEATARPATEILLIPQLPWRRYRIDFALRVPTNPRRVLFVECDGAEFHRATAEQIARDQARDQEIRDAGFFVFRFTGTDINRHAEDCARSVIVPEIKQLKAERAP